MDRRQAIEVERAALMRLAGLLCALADLAALAAGRSPGVRSLVLWLLGHAETVARDFVTGVSLTGLPALDPANRSPDDAHRLARRFRTLARHLEREARLMAASLAGDRAMGRQHGPRAGLAATPALHDLAPSTVHAPDTS